MGELYGTQIISQVLKSICLFRHKKANATHRVGGDERLRCGRTRKWGTGERSPSLQSRDKKSESNKSSGKLWKWEGALGLSWWLSSEESACNAGETGDLGSIPGLERSPGEGNGNPLQYSCLENPRDRGVWWTTVHRVAKSQTQLKWLSTHALIDHCIDF